MNNSNREVNGRKNFIDNIRSLCVYSLFIWHASEVFHCKEGFYIEGEKSLFLTIVYNLASPGLMAILFFTAGVSSMLSLKKRTIREFYQNLMQKIVIPGVIGLLFWVPIQSYFTMKNHFDYTGNFLSAWWYFYSHISSNFYGYDGSFSPSQLWFLLYLGTYVILSYPVIRRLLSKPGELSNKEIVSWKSILLLVILNWILSYGTTEETYLAFGLFFY